MSFVGAVEEGGEQGVQLGGGLGLQAFQRVELGHDPALLVTAAANRRAESP